ncbi:hypothetical protein [Sphingomonas humi]|uniref:Glycosyltransferase RgtA/B/C/D-like domain-containing protein n=1 Tax=Sphingomonas humi TaxID=335630 RepID=A0ABP7RGL2_9SPHN
MIEPAAPPSPPGTPRPWWETRAFVVVMVLLSAVPLLYPPIPPLVDLLGHMGRYRVMLDGDVPSLAAVYSFQWSLMGNLGVDLAVFALAKLVGLEAAVKLVIISIPMMTTAGMLWIAREVHHRLPPTVMFALPFVYGHHFLFGFVNYSLSVALAMLAFGLWLRLGRLHRYTLRAALFVPISIIVWLCHAFGWGFLGLLAFSSEVVRAHDDGRSWWRSILRAGGQSLSLALPLLLMLLWREGGGGVTADYFNWKNKWFSVTSVLRDRWKEWDRISFFLCVVVFLFAIVHPRLTLSRMLTFTALVLAAAFALLPRIIFGSAYADMRLMPFVIAFAMLAIRFRRETPLVMGWILASLSLAFMLARTISVTWSLALASDEYSRQLTALDHMPMGARVVSLVGLQCTRGGSWQLWRNAHIGGMVVVRKEGFSNDHWSVPGAKLLTVTNTKAGWWRHDPSNLVADDRCRVRFARPISWNLSHFPRDAFDYLWLVNPPPFDPRLLAGMEKVWGLPDGSALYRIHPGPAKPGQ